MKVFLADRSVDKPAEEHELFHFTKKFVGVTSSDEFMTIDEWVSGSIHDAHSDLLLQMDIEGYEYETILGMSDELSSRFRIIVAEFHMLDQLWNLPFYRVASRAFEKILQSHVCVHIHPNNCCGVSRVKGLSIPSVAEFTFVRKDRNLNRAYANCFPHPLDVDNTSNTHVGLPDWWRRMP